MGLDGSDSQMLHKRLSRLSAALGTKAYYSAGAVGEILLSSLIISVTGQSAVIYICDLIIGCKELCHLLSILTVTRHPYMQRFQSETQIECILRGLDGTEVTHQLCRALCDEGSFLAEFLCIGDAVI